MSLIQKAAEKATRGLRSGKPIPPNVIKELENNWITLIECEECSGEYYGSVFTSRGRFLCWECAPAFRGRWEEM